MSWQQLYHLSEKPMPNAPDSRAAAGAWRDWSVRERELGVLGSG